MTSLYSVSKLQTTFESGGKEIRVECFLPQISGPCPSVLALYGSGGGHTGMAEPAGLLASQGFAVYILHYFDRTDTERVTDKTTLLRNAPAWLKTLWDAVNYVEKQPQTDPARIGLLGFSLGAYLSLAFAAHDSRIKTVVEFFGGFPREARFFMRRMCPVLILHGENDAVVPVQEAYDLQKLLEKKNVAYEIQIYPDAGHGFSGEVGHDAGLRTLAFLQKYLNPHPPQSD